VRLRAGLWGVALLGGAVLPAAAQNDGGHSAGRAASSVDAHIAAMPVVHTARLDSEVHLDGRLDEGAWSRVQPASAFVQTEPVEGAPATERTEVFVLFDDVALYIGARLHDSGGDVRQRLGRRDSFLFDSDWFSVSLDSYHDHINAYQFSVNPAGVKRDVIVNATSRDDSSWDAVWDVATQVDPAGWSVEMRIPFSQLRFSSADVQTWGIQFSRRMIAKEEVSVLAFTPKSMRGGPARYAHLVGLEGLRAGKRFEVLPYVATRAEYVSVDEANPYRSGRDYFASTGADVKYRVTSALTLDATINLDFGQVEVDPAQVNLSAFETSFDEKRPFFVEGSDIFRFGEVRMFYSRRVGRTPQGGTPDGTSFSDRPDASTILGAAKLTGQTASGWRIGALGAVTARESARFRLGDGQDGEVPVEPRTAYIASRLEKNFRDGQSSVGGILTAVDRQLDYEPLAQRLRSNAYAGGIDFTHQFLDRTWQVDGYLAASHVSGSALALVGTQRSSARYYQRPDAEHLTLDSTATAMFGYTGRLVLRKTAGLHWRGEANVSMTSPGFEVNDLGFQTGVDRIGGDLNVTYQENRPGATFRNWRISLRNSQDWNYGWDNIGGRSNVSFNGQLLNYWGGQINFTRGWQSFDDRLTRGGPLAVEPARYNVDFNVSSDGRRRMSGRVNGEYGWNDGGGWNSRASGNVTLRPAENWTVSAGPSLRRNYTAAQYITTVDDASAVATFGRRYVFAPLDQTTLSMETRLNVNFSPTVSFDLFAQPFISSGEFDTALQLRAPRTYSFDRYDGNVADNDFVNRSLRGNAVLRWEWQPGSTVFVVWQQRRAGSLACETSSVESRACRSGRFDFARDARAVFASSPDNVFQVKMTYWLNL
jgi:hypothetical protein